MSRKSRRGAVSLPKGVHHIVSRAREYFYFQADRGTPRQGPRIALPNDPHSPEFWKALRQAQGLSKDAPVNTVGAAADAFIAHCAKRVAADDLSDGTLDHIRRAMKLAREMWGDLSAEGLAPGACASGDGQARRATGQGKQFPGGMRAFSTWARARDHIEASLSRRHQALQRDRRHQPWAPEQINAGLTKLTGVIRKGFVLYRYTGMRGSDVVRLGPTMIDDGGFDLGWRGQVKTGVRPWCPILPELAAEMATWEKRPGPFLLQEGGRANGKPYTRKLFWTHFKEQADKIPELAGVTLHGLRATAVIELRRAGLSDRPDRRYRRHVAGDDRTLLPLRRQEGQRQGRAHQARKGTPGEQNCKTLKNCKTQRQEKQRLKSCGRNRTARLPAPPTRRRRASPCPARTAAPPAPRAHICRASRAPAAAAGYDRSAA